MTELAHSKYELRPYQKEALDSIPESGAFLICLFTGAGKTVCMSQIPRRGRMLILSHRDELVHQPEKYFDCSFGVEQGKKTSHGEEVVSASVQSLVRRLDKFKPDDFDVLVTDECFIAGTLVDGKPIETIKEGDYVRAFNHKTNRIEYRQVIHTFKRTAPSRIMKVGGHFYCTKNHPIYDVEARIYRPADELPQVGTLLFNSHRGVCHAGFIQEIYSNEICHDGYVYNIEVEELNNYFANGILVHNCHHAAAQTYRKIYDYFKPRLHIGFTATPNRNDGVGLKDIFQDIIFERNLRWGIENHYLSPLRCLRVDLGVDLQQVAVRLGDYAPEQLARVLNIEQANNAIAEAYRRYAEPPCLIFCASVDHAKAVASLIDGAVTVKGGEDRSSTIEAFKAGEIPCITNCMVFTEGTDLPNIRTVIMARPTKNISLYTQAVGRATRLYPDKDYALVIDCVGIGDKADLCTAPSLLGLDLKDIPPNKRKELQGNLFDLPEIADSLMDSPEVWIKNAYYVDLWARRSNYDLHGVNYFRMPDGSMLLSQPEIILPPEDSLGRIYYQGRNEPAQKVFDAVYQELQAEYSEKRILWDADLVQSRWGNSPASEKQLAVIQRRLPEFDTSKLTKFEAAQIITRCMGASEPATSKQIYFIRRYMPSVDVNNLTKSEASKLIGQIKKGA